MTNEKREKLIEAKEEELAMLSALPDLIILSGKALGAAQSHGRGYQAA